MALPRKHSRVIDVGGVRYRWLVRSRPTYWQGIGDSMTCGVSLAEKPASILLVDFSSARPDNWVERSSGVVTPRVMRDVIETALAQGWDPRERGRFELRYSISSEAQPRDWAQSDGRDADVGQAHADPGLGASPAVRLET